jgi:hypothetical protein
MTSFTFRLLKRYRAEITFQFSERLLPNTEIARKLEELGFSDVNVSGEGRHRIVEATWDLHDAKISLKEIPITIDGSKSQFPLAALLQGIGNAKELQPPKKVTLKRLAKGRSKARRKRRRP